MAIVGFTAEPLAFSATEAERLYRLDRSLICKAVRQGKLPAFQPGKRRYLILRRDFEAWLCREHTVTPTESPHPDPTPKIPQKTREAVERRLST